MSEVDKPDEDWLVHFNRERMIIEREKAEIMKEELKTKDNSNDKKINTVSIQVPNHT